MKVDFKRSFTKDLKGIKDKGFMNERPTPAQSAGDPSPATASPKPVVMDSDVSPDDWTLIPYLLQHPDVAGKAITVSGTGEAHAGPGLRNVQVCMTVDAACFEQTLLDVLSGRPPMSVDGTTHSTGTAYRQIN